MTDTPSPQDAFSGADPSPAASAPGDSLIGRLRDLVVNPRRLMDNVGARPRWWQAGLLIFVVIVAFSWLTVPISAPEQAEMMRDSKLMQMMPEEAWQAQYDAALNVSPGKRAVQSLTAGMTSWLMVLVFGFILGFFVRMSGGKGTFRQALGVVSWGALLPFAVGPLVKLPLVLITESVLQVNVGLAALASGDTTSALFKILATYGDFLIWWGVIVLIIGFERVFSLTRNAALISVLLPWALLNALPLAMYILFM